MEKSKKSRAPGWAALLLTTLLLAWGSTAYAGQMELPEGLNETSGETVSVVASVTEDTRGYEQADVNSRVAAELKEGQSVVILLDRDGVWCQVICRQQKMYVQKKYLQEGAGEEVAKEMQELEAVRASEAEQDVEIRKEKARARTWGIVIAVLIAGIFAAGIIAVVRSGGGDKQEEDGE